MEENGFVPLCGIDDIQDPGSKGVTVTCGNTMYDMFVVRFGADVRAYLNSCPHTGGPLDWVPDQFLDIDRKYIQCATHSALFDWQDGSCIQGPCSGDSLTAIAVTVVNRQVVASRRMLCGEGSEGSG